MENPDTPWLRDYEGRSPKPFLQQPSPAAVFFRNFLQSRGVRAAGERLADVGCGSGRDSVFFARSGFEVHAIERDGSKTEGLELHGVQTHNHSAMDSWLFEDGFFDFAIDVLCYSGEQDAEGRKFYRSELKRTLRKGGYYLLCLPLASRELAKEFAGFEPVASEESVDCGTPVVSILLRAKTI